MKILSILYNVFLHVVSIIVNNFKPKGNIQTSNTKSPFSFPFPFKLPFLGRKNKQKSKIHARTWNLKVEFRITCFKRITNLIGDRWSSVKIFLMCRWWWGGGGGEGRRS